MANSLRYAVLGSGSSANSYIFSFNETTFLIDNGYSKTELLRRISLAGFDSQKIDAIFLTHMHQDHFRGVEALSKKLHLPLYANPAVLQNKIEAYKKVYFDYNKTLSIKDLTISSFKTFHDSPGSMGYTFSLGKKTVTLITDTGTVSSLMEEAASNSNIIFLEANYCPKMLESGPYPEYLKKRIDSKYGHLSNIDSINFLNRVCAQNKNIDNLYLCHVSKTNNSVDVIENYINENYSGYAKITICPYDTLVKQGVTNE